MSRRRRQPLFVASLLLLAFLFVPRLFLGRLPLYADFLDDPLLRQIAAVAKLIFLAMASWFAARCAAFFERGNRVRPGWILLAIGMTFYLLGQSSLAYYQLLRSREAPFPSPADIFFVASMLSLVAGLWVFFDAYRRVGYLSESGPTLVFSIACVVAVGVAMVLLFGPVLSRPAPLSEQALNVAYPVLDCLLLLPAMLLMQVTIKMRGGRLWRVWTLLLGGFLLIAVGDVLFAYFTTLEMEFLDPLLHLSFSSAYVLIAWGTQEQLSILTE